MTPEKSANQPVAFLDLQALVGVTKHPGGFAATDELLALCHVETAREVLNIGCGIGVAPAYVARKHGCRVVGVDISEQMIQWSRQRACEEHVADKVELHVADVLALPFAAGRFDVEDQVKRLVLALRERFPGAELIFDSVPWVLPYANGLHPALRTLRQSVAWGLRSGNDLEAWHPGIHLVEDWHYFDQPEPRLGRARLMRYIPIFGQGYRVVHYRLGEAMHVQD